MVNFFSYVFLFIYCIPTYTFDLKIKYIWYSIWTLGFAWALLVFFAYKYYKNIKLVPVLAWLVVIILSMLLNKTEFTRNAQLCMGVFSTSVLTLRICDTDIYTAIRRISFLFFTLMCLQGYSLITHCFGLSYDQAAVNRYLYFFGLRVDFSRFFIFAITIVLINAIYGNFWNKLEFVISFMIGVAFIIHENVSTGIMTIITFIMMLFLASFLKRITAWRKVFTISFLACFLFGILYVSSDYLSIILVKFLNEGLTLNGRTYLWQQAIAKMRGWHWIIGNGYAHSFVFSIGSSFKVGLSHSQYIDCLFDFGVVGIVVYLLMFYKISSGVDEDIDDCCIKIVIIASLFSILITGIPTSFFSSVYMYIYYVITVNSDALMRGLKSRTKPTYRIVFSHENKDAERVIKSVCTCRF